MVSPPGVENSVVLDDNKTRKGFPQVLSFSEARRLGRCFGVCGIGISRHKLVSAAPGPFPRGKGKTAAY